MATPMVRWIQSALGALSVIYIIDEITPAKLYGKLAAWVDSYAALISATSEFLFGWIEWEWFSIHRYEAHAILLLSLSSAAFCRVTYRGARRAGARRDIAIGSCVGGILVALVFPIFVFGFLIWWISIPLILPIMLFTLFFEIEADGRGFPNASDMRRELRPVIIIFAALLVLNYGFFKWT
ncbi:MAG: hypothetical protein AAGB51_05625 [Planctomycetota bacterium]